MQEYRVTSIKSWRPPYVVQCHCEEITHVVFKAFDDKSGLAVEVYVPWQKAWEYYFAHKFAVVSIRLSDNSHIFAKAYNVGFDGVAEFDKAPEIAQGMFKIVSLAGGRPLLELKGVQTYANSKRTEADAQKLLDAQVLSHD